MLDRDGHVTEATTANLAIYVEGQGFATPPQAKVLPGISLRVLAQLAGELGIPLAERDLTTADVAAADEVLLTSTSPCILPVTRLNGRPIGQGVPGPVHRQLLAAWSSHVGVDIAKQAGDFASRA
jgi:branched-subunit amino acid aminotransferase/4-amino-4-deoxychorismate lyase